MIATRSLEPFRVFPPFTLKMQMRGMNIKMCERTNTLKINKRLSAVENSQLNIFADVLNQNWNF